MRPVLLEMEGFATFRERTVVSFADADYFALVGPTGAGKSTLLDAITFALYRTVARWDDEKMVSPALAASVNRGVVRLIFDVSGHRYSVVREIRRSGGKNSTVGVRSSRLERLSEPDALTESATDILASDSEVTPAIEKLLGLTFKHFSTCVALPQGAFAEFLHVKSGERQKILAKLLGLDVYSDIARAANARATEARNRADVLTGTLAGYDDVSNAALGVLAERAEQLQDLDSDMDTQLAALDRALTDTADAHTAAAALTGQLVLLNAVHTPDGVAELESERAEADTAAQSATEDLAASQAAVRAAREKLRDGPDKAVLEQLRRDWADHKAVLADLPAAASAVDTTAAALTAADSAHIKATADLESARDLARHAHGAAGNADTALTAAGTAATALRSVVTPEGFADTAQQHQLASAAAAAAREAVEVAEAGDDAAQRALAASPDAAALAVATEHVTALRRHLATDASSAAARAASTAALAAAKTDAAAAETALQSAEKALADAEANDVAQTLRHRLTPGDPCPVCEQTVHDIPAEAGAGLGNVRADVETARAAHKAAAAHLAAASRVDDRLVEDRKRTLAAAETARHELVFALTGPLAGAVTDKSAEADALATDLSPQTTDTALSQTVTAALGIQEVLTDADTCRKELASAAAGARTALTTSRAAVADADRTVADLNAGHRDAVRALRDARERLLPYDPPPVDDSDLAGGWATLTQWAATQEQDRAAAVALAEADAVSARARVSDQDTAVSAAEATCTAQDKLRTAAARAAERAETELGALTARHQTLTHKLDGASSDGEAAAQLDNLAELTETLNAAQTAEDSAHKVNQSAFARVRAAADRVAQSRKLLAETRDPLVGIGAPPAHEDNILSAWMTLTRWGADLAARVQVDAQEAADAAALAEAAANQAETEVCRVLSKHGVALEDPDVVGRVLLTQVPVVLARDAADARSAEKRMAERLAQVTKVRADIADSELQSQVARKLGNLMRIDGFPQWLNTTALDSLVAEASDVLSELSGGQFDLTHSDGDFWIIDHNEADALRPVKTLSGGETFQASLALALALSSQMSSLAAAGAAQLESIFLDEGFGTLDEATLDTVAGTLENLATSGSRMVGVVTHVAALADRVPVRFAVTRDAAGSHISRESL
jgi:exonuclease SbcC